MERLLLSPSQRYKSFQGSTISISFSPVIHHCLHLNFPVSSLTQPCMSRLSIRADCRGCKRIHGVGCWRVIVVRPWCMLWWMDGRRWDERGGSSGKHRPLIRAPLLAIELSTGFIRHPWITTCGYMERPKPVSAIRQISYPRMPPADANYLRVRITRHSSYPYPHIRRIIL